MSEIQNDLDGIMNARYGKDVRQSIHDGILDCHEDANMAIEEARRLSSGTESALEEVAAAIEDANRAAEETRETTEGLTQEVNTAIENSNTASNAATQAAKDAQDAAQEAREAAENIGERAGVGSIKGDAETEYRSGDKINLTPADLGALSLNGDAQNNTVTFTSNDSGPDGDHAVLEVEKLTTGETLSSIMQKLSRMFTNIRYLLRLAGSTDISQIGDGTITGAVTALQTALNTSSKNTSITLTINTGYFTTENEQENYVEKKGNCVRLQLNVSLAKAITAWSAVSVTTIPAGFRPTRQVAQYMKLNGIDVVIRINTNGNVSLQAFQSAACNFIIISIPFLA